MDLRIKQLKAFLALAETLHFGKAAQLLYMSQPALTFQIQSMESAIGMQLFNRDKRRVELTEAGKSFVITGNRIMSELRKFRDSLDVLSIDQPLRMVCAPSGEQVILPAVIRRLKEMSPNSSVNLCSVAPIEQLRALQDNRVDVLLMVPRVDTPGVEFLPITNQQMYAVVPESSVFAKRGYISVHDFKEQPVIVTARQHCDQTLPLIEKLMAPFSIRPRFIEAPSQQSAQFSLVAAGMGLTIASEWPALVPFPGIKMVSFKESLPPLQLGAAWRTSFESTSLSRFKAALREVVYELGKHKSHSLASSGRKLTVASVTVTPGLDARQAPKYLRA